MFQFIQMAVFAFLFFMHPGMIQMAMSLLVNDGHLCIQLDICIFFKYNLFTQYVVINIYISSF